MDTVFINFLNANKQAKVLEELADRLKKTVTNDFDSALQSLSADWQSDNAAAYLRKGSTLQAQMTNTANDILVIASNIRRTARRIYEAEKKAEELARMRKTKS